jgi:hypothetical protein
MNKKKKKEVNAYTSIEITVKNLSEMDMKKIQKVLEVMAWGLNQDDVVITTSIKLEEDLIKEMGEK